MRLFNPSYIEAGHKGKAIAFTAGLLVLLACSVFVTYRAARNNADRSLFIEAKRGDLSSIGLLERRGAFDYIKYLAQDRTAATEARIAAMSSLQKLQEDSSGVVAFMLSIKEPFVVRQAAVDYFKLRGCNDTCTSALLQSIRAIWNGELTYEQSVQPQSAPTEALLRESQQLTQSLTETTTSQYLALLRRNPCLTFRVVAEEPTLADDATFTRTLRGSIQPCVEDKP